jgi:virginiamycin B lyase
VPEAVPRKTLSSLARLALGIGLAAGVALNPLSARAARAATFPAIDYPVDAGADPWGTAFDSQGNIWVAVPGCDPSPNCSTTNPGRIEEFSPSAQSWIADYQLPAGYRQAAFLAVDSTGNIWFPLFGADALGRFDPATQTFTRWAVPTPAAGPWDIAIDHNGNIWFTEHYVNKIGEFNPATQTFTQVATPAANSQPYGITVDSGNNIWFTENNPSVALIAEYTSAGQLQEFKIRATLPGTSLTPHLIAVDPGGNVWWTEGWTGMIGELNPAQASPGTTNGVTEYAYPRICGACGTHASGISVDSSGTVWFDDSLQGLFGSYSPGTGSFDVSATPSADSHPHDGMNVDGAGDVWFDEEFGQRLAESGPGVPVPPAATPGPFIAQDTFQRPDRIHWGRASDGNAWKGAAATSAAFTITADAAVAANPGAALTGTLGASATDEQVVATGSTSAFGTGDYGVILRFSTSGNWYKASINGSDLLIRRDVNGKNAVIGTVPFAAAAGTPYTLKFQAVGRWLLAKAWPAGTGEPASWTLVTHDASLTGLPAGRAGVQVHGSSTFTYTSFAANALITGSRTPSGG